MKRTKIANKIMLLAVMTVLLISLLLVFVGCGTQLDGTYIKKGTTLSEEFGVSGIFYVFKGNTVTVKIYMYGKLMNEGSATYRIKGDQIIYTSNEPYIYLANAIDGSSGRYIGMADFEMGDDYIRISGNLYTKYTDELPE